MGEERGLGETGGVKENMGKERKRQNKGKEEEPPTTGTYFAVRLVLALKPRRPKKFSGLLIHGAHNARNRRRVLERTTTWMNNVGAKHQGVIAKVLFDA